MDCPQYLLNGQTKNIPGSRTTQSCSQLAPLPIKRILGMKETTGAKEFIVCFMIQSVFRSLLDALFADGAAAASAERYIELPNLRLAVIYDKFWISIMHKTKLVEFRTSKVSVRFVDAARPEQCHQQCTFPPFLVAMRSEKMFDRYHLFCLACHSDEGYPLPLPSPSCRGVCGV